VIDLFGYQAEDIRQLAPAIYQYVVEHVKPERAENKRETYRKNWWLFGEPRKEWREMSSGLSRYVVTAVTSKHRVFQSLENSILPDDALISIALSDFESLGILSSRPHCTWALRLGSTLEDRPRYIKTRCFETFPFPELGEATRKRIADLAEQLDAHRKRQQAQHPSLTMTGMYNVLEKLRRQALPGSNETSLTDKEKEMHEQGLVSVLRELHDDLDRAVFQAYGWDDLADKLVGRPGATTPWPEKPEDQLEAEEELLQRLVDLNHQRAAEEAQGKIRWLRPDYQAPEEAPEEAPEQGKLDTGDKQQPAQPAATAASSKKPTWPKTLQAQIRAVRDQLETAPMDAATLASQFKRKPEKSVNQVLDALVELGMVKQGEKKAFRLRDN